MPRIDHVALESSSPEALAAFYERALGARIVRDEDGIPSEERVHEIAVGLFFRDPDGRQLEAITYRGGGDARR